MVWAAVILRGVGALQAGPPLPGARGSGGLTGVLVTGVCSPLAQGTLPTRPAQCLQGILSADRQRPEPEGMSKKDRAAHQLRRIGLLFIKEAAPKDPEWPGHGPRELRSPCLASPVSILQFSRKKESLPGISAHRMPCDCGVCFVSLDSQDSTICLLLGISALFVVLREPLPIIWPTLGADTKLFCASA